MCVTTVIWDSSCVGYDIWDRQLECSIYSLGGVQGQGYKDPVVFKGSTYRRYMYKVADICSMMMRDDFLLLFPKTPQGSCVLSGGAPTPAGTLMFTM